MERVRKRGGDLPRSTPFRLLGGWDRALCSPEQVASVLSLIRVEGTEILGASSSGPRDRRRSSFSVGGAGHHGLFLHCLPDCRTLGCLFSTFVRMLF